MYKVDLKKICYLINDLYLFEKSPSTIKQNYIISYHYCIFRDSTFLFYTCRFDFCFDITKNKTFGINFKEEVDQLLFQVPFLTQRISQKHVPT